MALASPTVPSATDHAVHESLPQLIAACVIPYTTCHMPHATCHMPHTVMRDDVTMASIYRYLKASQRFKVVSNTVGSWGTEGVVGAVVAQVPRRSCSGQALSP